MSDVESGKELWILSWMEKLIQRTKVISLVSYSFATSASDITAYYFLNVPSVAGLVSFICLNLF